MPTHYFSITTPMVCGGCTSTVEAALKAVEGVTAVSVSLTDSAAKIETSSDAVACTCAKQADGVTCKCGDNCKCMETKLLQAVKDAGFEAKPTTKEGFKCGSGTAAGPCGAKNCTCGDNCQCGTACKCAGCPGKACGAGGKGACGKWLCTCGPNCQCGANCTCAQCNGVDLAIKMGAGAALFAIGWMAATKFGKK